MFLNAVAALWPGRALDPEGLLAELQQLERDFGRKPKRVANEARPLDLDLITFRDERRDTPSLVLPHPRAHRRRFVLEPLAEIAPNFRLPGQIATASELLAGLKTDETTSRFASLP
jgi:2-amino-4-hydroxy-6-hydroxymethyldihydropteridine diphosphokinase